MPIDPADPIVEATVVLEVVEPPRIDALYFWALQATFRAGRAHMGGAHLGLQWHPRYPGGTAANWGGYHGRDTGQSGELPGSPLTLPSALDNPNTCNFDWRAGIEYRLRIVRTGASEWAGTIEARGSVATTLRHLHCEAEHLTDLAVWTEAFADCDAPPAEVRWTEPVAITRSGAELRAVTARVNYQSIPDGGCSTSDSSYDGIGILQRTGVPRRTPQGTILPF